MVGTRNVRKYRSWTSAHAKARSGRHYHHGASEVRWPRVGESVIADHTFLCSDHLKASRPDTVNWLTSVSASVAYCINTRRLEEGHNSAVLVQR